MRLTITSAKEQHAESCTVIAVSLSGEILSGSDDFSVRRWSASGEALGVVKQFESGVTAVAWVPVSGAARRTRGAAAGVSAEAKDNCIVACADGTFCFLNAATGRVERTVEAHVGSITSLVYAVDGSSILTAGEDGCIKVWSQAGIPRSTLANAGKCVYALCWGMETTELGGECVLYTTGTDVVIKPMNPTIKKTNRWKAHNGVVLCADWSRMSGLIVTGGEDGVFKVWDPHGRNVFTSAPGKQPITSVKFSADGDTFAVGSFMNVRICDKTGWSHTYERLGEGSAMAIQWMPDGTQLAIGGGTGALCLAQLVDRKISWGSYTVSQTESRKLLVHDVATDRIEEIVQKDTIIKVEIGYGYIVVCTTTLCACYNVLRLDSPVLLDLRDAVITLKLGPKLFMVADCSQGIQLFSYEGRPVSVLRLQASLRPDILISDLLSVSADTVVMRSPTDRHRILFFDVNSGKQLEDLTIVHHVDIISVHLSQSGTQFNRKIVFVDRNQDLYFSAVHKKSGLQKMSTMTSSVCWHDEHEILIAICDGRLTCWYYPSILFIDPDLIPQVKHVRDEANEEFSRNDNIVGFHEARVQVRRGGDGALLTLPVSPFPSILFKLVESNKWSSASRLVCFLDDQLLWAVLAGQALIKEELNIAEICYGALFDLAKVRYIHALKLISSPVLRQAKLALLQHRTTDAERVAIEGGLPLFAMEMLADLCNVSRVRELGKEMRVSDIVVDLMLHGDRRLWRLLELRRIFMKEQLNHPIRGSRMEPHVNELFFWFCSSQKGKHSFSKDFTSLENISKNLYGEDERIDHAVAGPVRASISDALNLPTGEDASTAVKKIRRIKQMATNPAIEEEEKKDLVDLVVWFRDYPLSFEGLRDLKEFGVDISEKLFTDSDSTLRDTLVQRVNFALELLKGEGDK